MGRARLVGGVPDRSAGRRRLSHAAPGGAGAARAGGVADRPEELHIALRHLQNLDPTGVGPQLRGVSRVAALRVARVHAEPRHGLAIAHEHLELLAARDLDGSRKRCNGRRRAASGQRLIQSLNPASGRRVLLQRDALYRPRRRSEETKNVWVASLNPTRCRSCASTACTRISCRTIAASRASQLSHQLQEARWLIKNVQRGFETILRVSQAIVDRQRHFFEHGEVGMRPLVLREIANTLGLHESTVSRYDSEIHVYAARHFRAQVLLRESRRHETGGACSATAIRALIKQLVAAEDARKPLSDSKISDILSQQGIVVARRTHRQVPGVALQIPSVSMRKSL